MINYVNLILLAISLNICLNGWFLDGYKVKSVCGFPGEPLSAEHNIDQRDVFYEDEVITYQCVDFLTYKQSRQCHQGKWIGNQVQCRNGVENDLKTIYINNCTTNKFTMIKNITNMKLDKNVEHFPNSFYSDRYTEQPLRGSDSQCYNWILHFNDSSYFNFVRIDFSIVYESVSESQMELIDVKAFVGSFYKQCDLDTLKKYRFTWTNKWTKYGMKYHYYFVCHSNFKENVLYVETKSANKMTIDLIRLAVGEIYGGQNDPACGIPEIPFGAKYKLIQEQQIYQFQCDEPNFISIGYSPTKIMCDINGRWNGSYPICVPTSTCEKPFEGHQDDTISNEVSIEEIENVYYFNSTSWFLVNGSVISYSCNDRYKMFGNHKRFCLENGTWSDPEPNCQIDVDAISNHFLTPKSFYLTLFYILLAIALIAIVIIAIVYFCLTKKQKYKREYLNFNQRISTSTTSAPLSTATSDFSYVTEPESNVTIHHVNYYHHENNNDEPIYDVPPQKPSRSTESLNKFKPKIVIQEAIYDQPKRIYLDNK